MASLTLAIFSVCFLSFVNCLPARNDDAPIEVVVPEACKGMAFCSEEPENYKEIQERISTLIPEYMLTEVQDREGQNNGGKEVYSAEENWHNCPTVEKIQTPKLAQDPLDTEKYNFLVQDKKFEQSFLEVTCPNALIDQISNNSKDRQCFPDLFLKTTNSGLQSTCEQKYATRQFYVFHHKNNTLALKTYRIPVYCSCKLSSSL